jgi:hypothetical protein
MSEVLQCGMSLPWHELPNLAPADGAVVWVRRGWFGSPWLATYNQAAQTFTSAGGLACPWWAVWRWRAQ